MHLIALLSLATVAVAADTRLVVWENANYSTEGGAYKEFITPSATCRNFNGADAWWNDRVSYVQIPPNTKCQFWIDINCKGGSLVIPAAPGGFVGAIPAKYNDQITSLACYV